MDAQGYGVAVKMVTGDHLLIARETAKRLSLGAKILSAEGLPSLDPVTKQKPLNLAAEYGDLILTADGFAQVFPEHKYLIVECLREMGYKVGMTGDGVNDAPALKRADIGIAVQGSTDAARAAADIVLTEPGLSTIVHGILIARCIFERIQNFITYRIAATLQVPPPSPPGLSLTSLISSAHVSLSLPPPPPPCSSSFFSSSRYSRTDQSTTNQRTRYGTPRTHIFPSLPPSLPPWPCRRSPHNTS